MFDLVIRGALVVDGTGRPSRRGSVGVSDGRIAAVGKDPDAVRRVITADGLAPAPGIMDTHTHTLAIAGVRVNGVQVADAAGAITPERPRGRLLRTFTA